MRFAGAGSGLVAAIVNIAPVVRPSSYRLRYNSSYWAKSDSAFAFSPFVL